MIGFSKLKLDNGLRVLVHEDNSTPLVAMNILYNVGSRDEDPSRTGLAHLFEHLMFGGTPDVPDFDTPLQLAGGENNAFTNSDITNFYITIPADNIETAFWLESDRMKALDFGEKSLRTQKKVVVEEFNQRYLNSPYGDAILHLRPLAYKVHPYRWATIGMDPSHIRKVKNADIRDFFYSHYAPNNAILTLAGKITPVKAFRLAEKWFGHIENRNIAERILPAEPLQKKARIKKIEKEVPVSAIYKAWHMPAYMKPGFLECDLITDLLSGGESGRLTQKLVKRKKIFSEIDAYITSDIDPGLIIVHGRLLREADLNEADEAIWKVIEELGRGNIQAAELTKVKNRFESSVILENTNALNKAMNLAFFEHIGNPDLINYQADLFRKIDNRAITDSLEQYMNSKNCTTLFYKRSDIK